MRCISFGQGAKDTVEEVVCSMLDVDQQWCRQHVMEAAVPLCPCVQDVAAGSAGSLLGLTNSCATAVGIAANLAAGALGGSRAGFPGVFALTAAFFLGSCLTWNACMKGDALVLGRA